MVFLRVQSTKGHRLWALEKVWSGDFLWSPCYHLPWDHLCKAFMNAPVWNLVNLVVQTEIWVPTTIRSSLTIPQAQACQERTTGKYRDTMWHDAQTDAKCHFCQLRTPPSRHAMHDPAQYGSAGHLGRIQNRSMQSSASNTQLRFLIGLGFTGPDNRPSIQALDGFGFFGLQKGSLAIVSVSDIGHVLRHVKLKLPNSSRCDDPSSKDKLIKSSRSNGHCY